VRPADNDGIVVIPPVSVRFDIAWHRPVNKRRDHIRVVFLHVGFKPALRFKRNDLYFY
jgi:hypothetical protein